MQPSQTEGVDPAQPEEELRRPAALARRGRRVLGQRDVAGLSAGIVDVRSDRWDQHSLGCFPWALVVWNHRPPPCKGEAKALVSGLSGEDRAPLSVVESL